MNPSLGLKSSCGKSSYCGWTKIRTTLKPWYICWYLRWGIMPFPGFLRWSQNFVHPRNGNLCGFVASFRTKPSRKKAPRGGAAWRGGPGPGGGLGESAGEAAALLPGRRLMDASGEGCGWLRLAQTVQAKGNRFSHRPKGETCTTARIFWASEGPILKPPCNEGSFLIGQGFFIL